MNVVELFWTVSLEEMKRGYTQDDNDYICLLCGKKLEKGVVYPEDGKYYEAERYMAIHIEREHSSVFDYLINMDKKLTGLSEHQNNLLRLFHQGKSDAEVQQEMGIGSSSTIRNHRFLLKEKERQARVFLVLMELLKGRDRKATGLIPPHKSAKMVDDRYNLTEEENEEILKKYFPHGVDGPLKSFDMREKRKLVVLKQLSSRFKAGRIYSEKEVNEIIKAAYEDYATIRRYLIGYGFLDRKRDGSQYWLKGSIDLGVGK